MTDHNFNQGPHIKANPLRWVWALCAGFVAGAVGATVVIYGVVLGPGAAQQVAPESVSLERDEKPFFTVGKRTKGPLTLEELQINIPQDVASHMTQDQRACFVRQIGVLAAQAGDPETLDPGDVAFLPTDGSWDDVSIYGRRGLLAQAIISRAIAGC